MFKNDYVVVLKQNDKLVDQYSKSQMINNPLEVDGYAVLEFGLPYVVTLKNKSNRDAGADIYIDGSFIGKTFLVPANGTTDINGYYDGKVKEFLFKDKSEIYKYSNKDAKEQENGILEVRFYREKEKETKSEPIIIERTIPIPNCWPNYYTYPSLNNQDFIFTTTNGIANNIAYLSDEYTNTDNSGYTVTTNTLSSAGITVEGNQIASNYNSVYRELETTPVIIRIAMSGHEKKSVKIEKELFSHNLHDINAIIELVKEKNKEIEELKKKVR